MATKLQYAGVTKDSLIYARHGYVPLHCIHNEVIWNSTDWMLVHVVQTQKKVPIWRVTAEYPTKDQRWIDCCATQLFHIQDGHRVFTYEAQELHTGLVLSAPLLPDYSRKPPLTVVSVEQLNKFADMYYIYEGYRTIVNGFLLGTMDRKG